MRAALGEEPDIPADFFGNPLDYVFNGTDYEPSSWNYENKDGSVKHIAEYCVDLKLATIEQTDPDTGQIYQPKLRLGGIYLTRNAGLMDLTEPQHADISLRYDVANCGEDIRQANRVFEPYENNATICNAVAGLGDGSLCVLPFSLKSQWMQGAVWETKIKKLAFEGREPVTALDVQYRCVYAGCATGRIAVFKIVAGSEDMDTLQQAAKELERLGYGKSGDAFKRKGGGLDGRATSMLREVVRLDYVFTLDCHSSTITSFCMAGGVLFSAATDMAIVSWMKPVDERNTQFQALGAAGQGSHQAPAMTQKYSHARVVHRAPVTAMAVAGDFLLSADADGHVCCHKAAKYREIVESKQAEADSKNFLEEEILEKPRFFHQLEISKISARHFLAHVIAHYYPIRPLKKRKKKAPGEGDDDDDEFEDEIADDVEADDEEYKEDREKSDDEGSEHDDELAGDFDGDFEFGGEDEDYDDLQGDFVGDPVAYEDEDEDYYDEDGAYFGDGFRSYPDDYDDDEDAIMEDPYAGYDEPSDYATPYDDEAYEAYEEEDELSEDDVRLDVGEHFGEGEDEDEDEEEEEDESGSEYED